MAENSHNTNHTEPRRIKCVKFTPDALAMFCEQGQAWMTTEGLPAGAKFVHFSHDPVDNLVRLWVEHESFPPLDPSRLAPELQITMHKIITKERMEEYRGKPIDGQNQLFVLA